MRSLISFSLVLLVAAPVVMGDDLIPPPWVRGSDGTTQAEWDFLTPDPVPAPDFEWNPYGQSELQVWPGVGQAWWEEWGGRMGVWPLSGTIEVGIPNRPLPLPYKEIWVQLTWCPQAPDTFPIVTEKLTNTPASLENEMPLGPTNEPYPAGDTWIHSTFKIRLEPNPDFEIVKIDGAIMVDQLVIDTICIPEPATMLLLSLGGLAVARRRRRA